MAAPTSDRKGFPHLFIAATALPAIIAVASGYAWADCSSEARGPQLHLVELYTSEGCDSCPPAEKWVSSLRKHPELAGLEFHVDYFDSQQWTDPFANHAYTVRQQALAKRSNDGQYYTPQIWLDGRLWKNWPKGAPPALAGKPTSTLSAKVVMGAPLRATFDVSNPDVNNQSAPALYAAVIESGLSRSVTGGENKGKRLSHDDVVRAFVGPLPLPHAEVEFKLPKGVDLSHSDVVGFVQDERDGTVTQVARVPLDACQK